VTECGQVIAPGQVAELKNDLTCAVSPTWPDSALGVLLQLGVRRSR
jgi:hypothetical protein